MLKVQCQCGHRMAVPDEFAGKRVKCAKCKGAVAVPMSGGATAPTASPRTASRPSAAAAAPAAAPVSSDLRIQRSRRHAMERKRKSHNITVAVVAGAMVVLGLGLLLFIGSMNRPVNPPAPPVNVASSQGGEDAAKSSSMRGIGKRQPASTDNTGEMGSTEKVADNSSETKEPEFTAGSASPSIAGTTATFDADGGVTTIVTQALPLTVAEKKYQMTMTVTHDGRDIRTATQLGALIRLTGDFTGLISTANSDEPRLTIEADGRDVSFQTPTAQGESDDRKGENGVVRLPKWVEYSLGKSEVEAIAKANSIRATLGGTIFDFSAEQLALFRALAPSVAAPVKDPDKSVSSDDAEPGSSEPKPAPQDEVDNDAPVEKEMMDEKMKKK